ncbi:MAG TPA: hypothetical protein VGE07_02355 [Herpetosiphonaceae bacterium]
MWEKLRAANQRCNEWWDRPAQRIALNAPFLAAASWSIYQRWPDHGWAIIIGIWAVRASYQTAIGAAQLVTADKRRQERIIGAVMIMTILAYAAMVVALVRS